MLHLKKLSCVTHRSKLFYFQDMSWILLTFLDVKLFDLDVSWCKQIFFTKFVNLWIWSITWNLIMVIMIKFCSKFIITVFIVNKALSFMFGIIWIFLFSYWQKNDILYSWSIVSSLVSCWRISVKIPITRIAVASFSCWIF